MKKFFLITFSFVFLAVFMAGCRGDQNKNQDPNKVTVMIYSEYFDPSMLTDFQMKTGYKLHLELYEAQEEMISKIQTSGNSQYDVIIASDVVIPQLIRLGFIGKIDTNHVFNRRNIAEQFLNPPYDTTNEYSVPYLWGTTGILYRDTTLSPSKVSYNTLWDEKRNKGSFSLLDESRSMLSMALMAKGYDANSTDPEQIKAAAEYIKGITKSKNFLGFDGSVSGKNKVLSRLNWAAVVFNGEAMAAMTEDPTLQFAIPIEGSFMWVDAMLLSSKAPNPEGAYAFMNYILDTKTGAKLAKYINYATPNKSSLNIIDSVFKKNNVVNPTRGDISRLVFLKDVGEAVEFYDQAWEYIKRR